MTGQRPIQDTGELATEFGIVRRIGKQIPGSYVTAYLNGAQGPRRSIQDLEANIREYRASLRARAVESEFLDLETARRVAACCHALLVQLAGSPSPAHHRAVQAAVDYFLLEDDGEEDGSIVGFDDDLEVVRVTAEVLGWAIPLENA